MQPDLFAATNARDEALARVMRNADSQWTKTAALLIMDVADSTDEFTTDEVWSALHRVDARTHEPRALGAVMKSLASAGLIVATDNWRQSIRPECHARPVRIWRRAE